MEIEVYEEKNGKKKDIQLSDSYYDNEEIKYFSYEEYTKLISTAKPFYKLVYLLFFETGARVSEARGIKYLDIDLHRNKIKIATLKQRKKAYRILPISDSLKAELLQHKIENNLENDDFILAKSPGKKAVIQQSMDGKLKRDCELLKIDRSKAHLHAWRHTRAIQLLDSGLDIVKVKMFLGHSNIQNTLIYLKYSNKDFDNAIKEANKKIGLL